MCDSSPTVWLAENLRLTAFTQEAVDPNSFGGSWLAIVGDEPDKVEYKPKQRILRESGSFRDATLTFVCMPPRIDWILHASEPPSDSWDNVSKFSDECAPFVDLMTKWLPESPALNRFAFGAVLVDPVESLDDGYRKVSSYLPFDVDVESRNFSYQINRRRNSRQGISGLEINRLSKWSCLLRQTKTVLSMGQMEPIHDESPELLAVRLEVDINTAPEYAHPLPSGSLADLFEELVVLGSEITEKGDIP